MGLLLLLEPVCTPNLHPLVTILSLSWIRLGSSIVDLTPPNISLWLLLDRLMMTGRPTSYMIINYIPGPRSLRSPPPHLWYFGHHHVRLRQRFEARHDLTNFFLHIKINVFNYPFFKKRSNWYHALVEITIKTKFYWEQSNNLSIYIGYWRIKSKSSSEN